MIKHFEKNPTGKDFVVGDIHGCFKQLEDSLSAINFDYQNDRLFSVGDLVDRGPDSEACLDWLNKPWFHSIRGNHEQCAIHYFNNCLSPFIYLYNGGAWFAALTEAEQQQYVDTFEQLPIIIDIETDKGLVGLVHANCPFRNWDEIGTKLNEQDIHNCLWDRQRILRNIISPVDNIHTIYVGHTIVKEVVTLGNITYIDTGIVVGGKLTVLQIN